ncbi:hypothetical protein, conserved [Eimeria brunetti]|uniref:EF-hand domain-containing protein n=1 Tax=Eimeria brunetti TaxID=51314 RepID=U6LIT0_9EIME|nr:hypothetical protein, conserved [Eimeria brunetti]
MNAHLQQVNTLLLEQKAVLMQQEKEHQQAIIQRRKVAKWEGSAKGLAQPGEAQDPQNLLTPRMSYEHQLTDDMLKRLLEKVFSAADEENAGKHKVACSIARLQHCYLLVRWASQGGNLFNFSPVLKNILRDGLSMDLFWSNVKRKATADAMALLFREELDETFRMTRELIDGMGSHVTSTADRISKIVADAEAQAEFEELRGLSVRDSKKQRASLAARRRSKLKSVSHAQLQLAADDGDQGESPDRESVEKTLVHLFTVLDDRRKGSVPAQVFVGVMHYWSARSGTISTSADGGNPLPLNSVSNSSGGAALAAERRYADIVMSCRLTPAEVTGFVAEAKVDPLVQEISYTEHIKAWVATIFEIRRSHFWHSVCHNSFDDDKVLKQT